MIKVRNAFKKVGLFVVDFLNPWPDLFRKFSNKKSKAILSGIGSSVVVLWGVWTVLIPHQDLSNRQVISVLVNPDFKVVSKGRPYSSTKLYEPCRYVGISPPLISTMDSSGISCRNWTRDYSSSSTFDRSSTWIADRYKVRYAQPRITSGNSRLDAGFQMLEPLFLIIYWMRWPFVSFLAMQVGIWVYRRRMT
jgi:hypothetical protein